MPDPENVGHGARLLAIETALRVLIDQTSLTEPAVRSRIRGAVDAYLATIPPASETEREFMERSRGFVESLLKPPSTSQ
ncbi:hypothetical protein [Hoeflea sp. BAL378]|uniref:hypothetical protein n=1 Tax=Hoeflea sp. BAL378 TaxID=1547437 RepID=UPI000A5285A9|nr:hypothetical protein [Hoeflea sp. BAL378]